jgi:carboxyl-terminal processing protease
VRISAFTKRTAASLDVALASLAQAKPTGLVVDLRDCPGGLFDVALEVSDRFLKKGERILSMKKRDGKEEVHVASGKMSMAEVPVVVIFDHHTASSAEILAAALIDNRGARTVGEQTFGKGTVEKVMELDNGWALKLSVARFYSPKGKSWQGVGIAPDFAIPSSEDREKRPYTAQAAPKPELDPQLRAALSLLASR